MVVMMWCYDFSWMGLEVDDTNYRQEEEKGNVGVQVRRGKTF